MYKNRDVIQQANHVIDVASWTHDSDEGPPARGARDKQTLIAPTDPDFLYLVGGHKYLLKFSNRRAPTQYWNEVLAHRLGAHIGISVPPTHVAVNSLTQQIGSLCEYFYGYCGHKSPIYRSGSDILSGEYSNYDRRRDKRHSFSSIASWCLFLERNRLMLEDWREYWGKAFLLDALLGNTDRHHDNWGTIWETTPADCPVVRFSPLFDNGTSMGYELDDETLNRMLSSVQMARYVNRGTHQMFWRTGDSAKLSHPRFLKKFYDEFPSQRASMLSRLRISDRTILKIIRELSEFAVPMPLTPSRAEAMFALIRYRRDYIVSLLQSPAEDDLMAA